MFGAGLDGSLAQWGFSRRFQLFLMRYYTDVYLGDSRTGAFFGSDILRCYG
jgi:hypothetical protein